MFSLFLQVACQSLGPLKNGGLVLGIDLKVSIFYVSFGSVMIFCVSLI